MAIQKTSRCCSHVITLENRHNKQEKWDCVPAGQICERGCRSQAEVRKELSCQPFRRCRVSTPKKHACLSQPDTVKMIDGSDNGYDH